MSGEADDEDDNYQPLDLGPPAPADETERRRLREAAEARAVRREILLGRLAHAYGQLYAAEEAKDEAKVVELRQTIGSLTAERDGI